MKKRRKLNGKKIWHAASIIIISFFLWTAVTSCTFIADKLPPWIREAKILKVLADEEEDKENEENLELTVHYGYDGYVKYGRFMNVKADITSRDHVFSGWIQVIVPKSKNNVAYRKRVLVTAGTKESVSIILPVFEDAPYMQVQLIDNNGNTVIENKYRLKIGNFENLAYVGILSDKPNRLKYLDEFGTRVFYLDKDSITDDYRVLDLLDIIVINQFDTSKLKEDQINALDKWVTEGGTLVIGTGEYRTKTLGGLKKLYSIYNEETGIRDQIAFGLDTGGLQKLKQDIIDYEEERKIFLETIKDRNKMLEAYGNETISVDTSLFNKWTKEAIEDLEPDYVEKYITPVMLKGGSVIVADRGFNLMQVVPHGHGKIQLFSFDLGLDSKYQTFGLAILDQIRNNLSIDKLAQLDEEYYGTYLDYGIYDGMSYTNAKEIPKTGGYLIILLIYLCLIGPVTFLVLKKLDRRNLTWCVVPLMAVIFTLIIYFKGSDTRIDEPYAGYVRILRYTDDNKVNEELYFSLTAPYNNDYSVTLDKPYNIIELLGNGDISYLYSYNKREYYYDNFITSINYGADKTELKIKDNPAFSPVYYQWDGEHTGKNRLVCDLHYTGDKISGTITNGFDFDINNAMLTSDGYVINIGKIKKGETIVLNEKDAIFMTTRDELYNTNIINRIAGGTGDPKDNTSDVNRLSNVLYYLTEQNLLDNQHKSCIIGFVDESDESAPKKNQQEGLLDDLAKNMKVYGTTAVQLPVQVDYREGNREYVPSIDPYILLSEGYYSNYYQSRYLSSDNMTVRYNLPKEDKVLSFEYLADRNKDNAGDFLNAFDGTIYFLNIKTGNYDEVFKDGPGSSVTNVDDYLTDQNTITIRYSTKMSLKGYQMVLPYISYWKEADTDAFH